MRMDPNGTRFYLWIGVFCMALLSIPACNGQRHDQGEAIAEQQDSAEEVVSLLQEMGHWATMEMTESNPQNVIEVEKCVRRIAAYDSDVIRSGIVLYIQRVDVVREGFTASDSNVLILNNFLFDLPETVPIRSEDAAYGAVVGFGAEPFPDPNDPDGTRLVELRWPWRVDEDGCWRLTEAYCFPWGWHSPYRVLGTFDYYRAKYGRRRICE